MAAMTEDEIRALIAIGHEQRHVEFKCAGNSKTRHFCGRVAAAVIAMANRRDGGLVFIGVAEGAGGLTVEGLDDAQAASWRHDISAARLAEYAQPPVDFTVEFPTLDGLQIAVLRVSEFSEQPVLARIDVHSGSGSKKSVLQAGMLYVRSQGQPGTTVVARHGELRALIDLAAEKRARRFLEVCGGHQGARVGGRGDTTSKERYVDELGEF